MDYLVGGFYKFDKRTDFFFIVTGIEDDVIDIIPGSSNTLKAGPKDAILPPGAIPRVLLRKSTFGRIGFLAMDMLMSISPETPSQYVGRLDQSTWRQLQATLRERETGEVTAADTLATAIPYVDDEDPRVEYHKEMWQWAKSVQKTIWQ